MAEEEALFRGQKRPNEYDNSQVVVNKKGRPTDQIVAVEDDIDGEKIVLKLLIPNYAAGSIIGKGGDVINDLQNDSKTRIRLSHSSDTFPGTKERIIVVTGSFVGVRHVNRFILEKVSEDLKAEKAIQSGAISDKNRCRQLKMVVPNAAAGVIIGKGGSNIKEIQDKSGAHVQVSQKNNQYAIDERILTLTGEFNERLLAWELIIRKCLEDSNNMPNATVSYTHMASNPTSSTQSYNYYGSSTTSKSNLQGSVAYDPYSSDRYSPTHATPDTRSGRGYSMQGYGSARDDRSIGYGDKYLEIPIADNIIGAILGKRGKVISDIQNISGAHIQVSQRGDYIAGTTNRRVTVTGTEEAIQAAHQLINERIEKEYEKQASNFISPQNY